MYSYVRARTFYAGLLAGRVGRPGGLPDSATFTFARAVTYEIMNLCAQRSGRMWQVALKRTGETLRKKWSRSAISIDAHLVRRIRRAYKGSRVPRTDGQQLWRGVGFGRGKLLGNVALDLCWPKAAKRTGRCQPKGSAKITSVAVVHRGLFF